MLNKRTTLIALIALIAVIALGVLISSLYNRTPGDITKQLKVATLLPSPKPLSQFSLKKTDGTAFNNKSLEGHWTLLFFGFTHCSNICPTAMTTLNQAYTQLEKNKITPPQVVFISIDPKRDSLAKIKKYTSSFNPNFTGATDRPAALNLLTKQLGVVYVTVKQNNTYKIDHTSNLFLIDPNGKVYAVFSMPQDADKIASDLAKIFYYTANMPVDLAHE